jgi:hypothetical protein
MTLGRPIDAAQVPHGRTAQRLTWRFLPAHIRSLVEEHLGSPVVDASSQDSGFTPGFASVLTGADGSRLFVKAASGRAQAGSADAYRQEARKLAALPAELPAPRLRWVYDDEGWVVLGFDTYDGRPPRRPWSRGELDRALDLAEAIADVTDPVPPDLELRPVWEDIPDLLGRWDEVAGLEPDWPHLAEAQALARSYAELPDRAFCHTDLRDDNVLLGEDGSAVACDWNWPALGPAWQDTVDLLVSAYGDGVDVEPILASRRLTRDVDPDHIDRWLAALCGYMVAARSRPEVPTSPYLRVHANWYAQALWAWLSERRRWG